MEALLGGAGPELLLELLGRLDEGVAEEAAAVYNTLAIFENMVEVGNSWVVGRARGRWQVVVVGWRTRGAAWGMAGSTGHLLCSYRLGWSGLWGGHLSPPSGHTTEVPPATPCPSLPLTPPPIHQVRGSVAELLLETTGLLAWLLGRIRARGSDGNRQYAAELLAILLQVGVGGGGGDGGGEGAE